MVRLTETNNQGIHPHAIRLAHKQASKDTHWRIHGFRHGAVLLHKGKVVAVNFNRPRTIHRNGQHAEAGLMSKVPRWCDPAKCIVVVLRVNRSGARMNSYPCDDCWSIMLAKGIKRKNVYWS